MQTRQNKLGDVISSFLWVGVLGSGEWKWYDEEVYLFHLIFNFQQHRLLLIYFGWNKVAICGRGDIKGYIFLFLAVVT